MSFSPRLQGDKARPSPSRFELWKEQLGIDGKFINHSCDLNVNATQVSLNTVIATFRKVGIAGIKSSTTPDFMYQALAMSLVVFMSFSYSVKHLELVQCEAR